MRQNLLALRSEELGEEKRCREEKDSHAKMVRGLGLSLLENIAEVQLNQEE